MCDDPKGVRREEMDEWGKKEKGEKGGDSKVVGTAANPPLNRVLPRVMVDGPFGSASEDFLNYEYYYDLVSIPRGHYTIILNAEPGSQR